MKNLRKKTVTATLDQQRYEKKLEKVHGFAGESNNQTTLNNPEIPAVAEKESNLGEAKNN